MVLLSGYKNVLPPSVPDLYETKLPQVSSLLHYYSHLPGHLQPPSFLLSSNSNPSWHKVSFDRLSGFPGGSDSKEFTCSAGDPGSIPGLGRSPGEGHSNPLQHFCWRIPWTEKPGRLRGLKELDVTEWLGTHDVFWKWEIVSFWLRWRISYLKQQK